MRQARSMDEVREFVAADRGLAVVSFARRDGSVHSSVVNAGVMAQPDRNTRVACGCSRRRRSFTVSPGDTSAAVSLPVRGWAITPAFTTEE